MLEKTNIDGYMIDVHRNVVINTNKRELQTYKSQIEQAQQIQSLANQLEEIKSMLKNIGK